MRSDLKLSQFGKRARDLKLAIYDIVKKLNVQVYSTLLVGQNTIQTVI